jgi:hypothetical protein
LWRSIYRQWTDDALVPDSREARWLWDACRLADLLAAVEVELAAVKADGGLVTTGGNGQAAVHPLVGESRQLCAQIGSLLGRLSFIDSAAAKPGRGSRTSSTQARAAAMSRYGYDR